MTHCWGPRQGWKRRWPLLGLLLVLLMLGHDALMATEALAAPHEGEATAHLAGDGSVRDHALPSHHDSPPSPAHPEQCNISIHALVRSPDDAARLAQLPLPLAQAVATVEHAPGWDWVAAWQEPHWPPGRLRAVTQVYRI